MITITDPPPGRPTVQSEQRRLKLGSFIGIGLLGMLLLVLLASMWIYPPEFGAAFLVLIVVVTFVFMRPALAFGAIIFLAVTGDAVSMPWWPVTKNLSAQESILYVTDALTIKPIDLVLMALVVVVVVNRRLTPDPPPLRSGPLGNPMLLFTIWAFIGLFWGIGRGGDIRIAYFEFLPLLYIPLCYYLASNLFTSLAHYRRLMVAIFVGLTIETLHTLPQLASIKEDIGEGQSAFEHTAANHFNMAILLVIALGWFGANRSWPRLPFFLALGPMLFLYIDGERRAGIVALIIGGVVLAIALFVRNHEKFMRTIPAALLVFAMYSAAFWGSSSSAAFPAQAVRSVVQPDAAGDADSSSDLYRDLENFNLNYTIRSNPVLGIGFGQPFLRPYPLPDISFFEFADYIPHNNLLWIWTKTGIVGFVSFVYMSLAAVSIGLRAVVRMTNPVDAAVMVSFVAYVPMALVVSYVDISIDPTTTALWGLALAAATSAERLSIADADGQDPAPAGDGKTGSAETGAVERTVAVDDEGALEAAGSIDR